MSLIEMHVPLERMRSFGSSFNAFLRIWGIYFPKYGQKREGHKKKGRE